MTDPETAVQITETIECTKTYTLSELRQIMGINLADMSEEEITSRVAVDSRVEEDMQHYGEVRGSKRVVTW